MLRPRAAPACAHLIGNATAGAAGLALASAGGTLARVVGQLMLAAVFVHAFVLLHEAGHGTLFRGRRANRLVGVVAGVVALIPFRAWVPVHARHHRWTGWQDRDATTASLVPRPLGAVERHAIDIAWRWWLPLFSLVYRIQNYWNVRRIAGFLQDARVATGIRRAAIGQALLYAAVIALVGPARLAWLIGPALWLSWVVEDVLLLSQHTHLPQHLSEGREVRPFRNDEQVRFTRSLRLPPPLSRLLMHFDLHEAHHLRPGVPGYALPRLGFNGPNTVDAWTWIRAAKRVPGSTFLFSNRDRSGAPL